MNREKKNEIVLRVLSSRASVGDYQNGAQSCLFSASKNNINISLCHHLFQQILFIKKAHKQAVKVR